MVAAGDELEELESFLALSDFDSDFDSDFESEPELSDFALSEPFFGGAELLFPFA